MGKCPFHTKNPVFCPISQTNYGNVPILKLDFLKMCFSQFFIVNSVISMLFPMCMIVVLQKALLMVILPMLLPPISDFYR